MSDSRYTVEVFGGCLGKALPDGTHLMADAESTIEPFKLCLVVLRSGNGPWYRFMQEAWGKAGGSDGTFAKVNCMAKIFIAQAGNAVLLGQLWPPTVGLVELDEVKALHAIVGTAGCGAIKFPGEANRAAFELLTRLKGGKPIEPINPDWRPPISLRADAA